MFKALLNHQVLFIVFDSGSQNNDQQYCIIFALG